MIWVGNVMVEDALVDEYFVCDLKKCKGVCCVEGASGAPLEMHEAEWISKNLNDIRPFLTKEGIRAIEKSGVAVWDDDGDLTTPLIRKNGPCVYAVEGPNGITYCAIEKYCIEKKSTFQKPASCHLYPIRIEKTTTGEILRYHRWEICKPACSCGKKLKTTVIEFLKNPLILRYGKEWYNELEKILIERKKVKSS